jgi:hypothetical protein
VRTEDEYKTQMRSWIKPLCHLTKKARKKLTFEEEEATLSVAPAARVDIDAIAPRDAALPHKLVPPGPKAGW